MDFIYDTQGDFYANVQPYSPFKLFYIRAYVPKEWLEGKTQNTGYYLDGYLQYGKDVWKKTQMTPHPGWSESGSSIWICDGYINLDEDLIADNIQNFWRSDDNKLDETKLKLVVQYAPVDTSGKKFSNPGLKRANSSGQVSEDWKEATPVNTNLTIDYYPYYPEECETLISPTDEKIYLYIKKDREKDGIEKIHEDTINGVNYEATVQPYDDGTLNWGYFPLNYTIRQEGGVLDIHEAGDDTSQTKPILTTSKSNSSRGYATITWNSALQKKSSEENLSFNFQYQFRLNQIKDGIYQYPRTAKRTQTFIEKAGKVRYDHEIENLQCVIENNKISSYSFKFSSPETGNVKWEKVAKLCYRKKGEKAWQESQDGFQNVTGTSEKWLVQLNTKIDLTSLQTDMIEYKIITRYTSAYEQSSYIAEITLPRQQIIAPMKYLYQDNIISFDLSDYFINNSIDYIKFYWKKQDSTEVFCTLVSKNDIDKTTAFYIEDVDLLYLYQIEAYGTSFTQISNTQMWKKERYNNLSINYDITPQQVKATIVLPEDKKSFDAYDKSMIKVQIDNIQDYTYTFTKDSLLCNIALPSYWDNIKIEQTDLFVNGEEKSNYVITTSNIWERQQNKWSANNNIVVNREDHIALLRNGPVFKDTAKIHFLTLESNTNSILIECNGRFGMIDSGENNDFPRGTDPRYPSRDGISHFGFDADIIPYLKMIGVTKENFDFYIGTHPHSDHIGSAAQVIQAFEPKTLYTPEYDDSMLLNEGGLWDNLYNYDNMIQAAKSCKCKIITRFEQKDTIVTGVPYYPENGISLKEGINKNISARYNTIGEPVFYLGNHLNKNEDLKITIVNTNKIFNEQQKTEDANDISFGVLLEYIDNNGILRRAFIGGDINNNIHPGYTKGDEDTLGPLIGEVDLWCMNHHGYSYSNSPQFFQQLVGGTKIHRLILPGIFTPVSNNTTSINTQSVFSCLEEYLQKNNNYFYPIGLYQDKNIYTNYKVYPALTFDLGNDLSVNVPSEKTITTYSNGAPYSLFFKGGKLTPVTGWVYDYKNEQSFYFDNSYKSYPKGYYWLNNREIEIGDNGEYIQ